MARLGRAQPIAPRISSRWLTIYGATSSADPTATIATGTGAALAANPAVTVNATIATGTGVALNATGPSPTTIAEAGIGTGIGIANPGRRISTQLIALGTGTALAPSAAVTATATIATGTGAALAASGQVAPRAAIATGTGTAYNPRVNDPLGRIQYALAHANTDVCNILFCGDSITDGAVADNYIDERFAAVLLRLLQAEHQTAPGSVGFVNTYSLVDNGAGSGTCYWTFGGGGTQVLNDFHAFGLRTYNTAVDEPATFHFVGTSFTLQHTLGSPAYKVTFDADSPVTVTPAAGTAYTGTYSSVVKASGSHTALIEPLTPGTAFRVHGATPHDGDDATGIRGYDQSLGGQKSTDFTATNGMGTVAGLTDQLTVCADPALVVITLGANDIRFGGTAAAFKTALTTIIANIKSLCATTPSFVLVAIYDVVGGTTWVDDWVSKLYEIEAADPTHVTVLDLTLTYARPTAGNSYLGGKVDPDGVHPTTLGHQVILAEHLDTHVAG